MDSVKTTSQSFIIRIWVEEIDEGTQHANWCGHITHVLSSKRLYFEDLDLIQEFIIPYLIDMEVTFGR